SSVQSRRGGWGEDELDWPSLPTLCISCGRNARAFRMLRSAYRPRPSGPGRAAPAICMRWFDRALECRGIERAAAIQVAGLRVDQRGPARVEDPPFHHPPENEFVVAGSHTRSQLAVEVGQPGLQNGRAAPARPPRYPGELIHVRGRLGTEMPGELELPLLQYAHGKRPALAE